MARSPALPKVFADWSRARCVACVPPKAKGAVGQITGGPRKRIPPGKMPQALTRFLYATPSRDCRYIVYWRRGGGWRHCQNRIAGIFEIILRFPAVVNKLQPTPDAPQRMLLYLFGSLII